MIDLKSVGKRKSMPGDNQYIVLQTYSVTAANDADQAVMKPNSMSSKNDNNKVFN